MFYLVLLTLPVALLSVSQESKYVNKKTEENIGRKKKNELICNHIIHYLVPLALHSPVAILLKNKLILNE